MRPPLSIIYIGILSIIIPGFSSSYAQSSWSLVGSAASQGSNCYEMTKALSNKRSAAWSHTKLNLKHHFDLYFRMNFGNNNGGADGMTVVLQKSASPYTALGESGMNLGYASSATPVDPSIDIEFDTYYNGWPANDPADDHCAINGNGAIGWTMSPPVPLLGPGINVEDNQYHIVQIDYQPSPQTLRVYFDCNLLQTFSYEFIDWIFGGDSIVYYGITAATGSAANAQSFCELYLDAGNDSTFCPGDSVTLSGNTNFSSYNWSPSQGLSCTNCLNPVAEPAGNSTYVLTASYGCLIATDTMKLSEDCQLLPIELVAFSATCDNNSTLLKWNTASELNNDYFSVERSGDAHHFQMIGTQDGAGNSTQVRNYSFKDEQPLPGTNYYRLRQVDFNGTSAYSTVQSVNCSSKIGLFVYPNPSRDETHLQIQSSSGNPVTLLMASMAGKIIMEKEITLNEGTNEILLDNHQLLPGVYDVVIYSRDEVLHTLLVIQ